MIIPRWYQTACRDAIWRALGSGDTVAQLPTGSGKSLVAAMLADELARQCQGRVCVLAHVKELLEQNIEALRSLWPLAPASYWCDGLGMKRARQVTFGSIQSIYQSTNLTGAYDLIIVDEAHRIPHREDGQYRRFLDDQRVLNPRVKIAGLTATPYRMKGGMLHEGQDALFSSLCYEQRILPLVAEGYLCSMVGRSAASSADMSGAHIRGGEFIPDEVQEAFTGGDLVKTAVDEMMALCRERHSVMVFSSGLEHSEMILEELLRRGELDVVSVDGGTSNDDRAAAVRDFRSQKIRWLVNMGVYTTGFDAKNVDAIVIMRATRSPGLYVQIAGRGLRTDPTKTDCLLLDYGGNIRRHGPLDEVTSQSAKKEPSESQPRSKPCPACGHEIAIGATICPHCGHSEQREERELNHTPHADDADPLKGAKDTKGPWEWIDVTDTYHEHHISRNSGLGMLRVTYRYGIVSRIEEFICFDHPDGSFPRQKAESWAARRGVFPAPTAADAAGIEWPSAKRIRARKRGKFWDISHYEF